MEGPPTRLPFLLCAAPRSSGGSSEPHLLAAKRRQVGDGGAALEVDLEIHRGEIGRRSSREEGFPLFGQIGAVLGAIRGRADIDDAGIVLAGVLVGDRVADVGGAPDRVGRLPLGAGYAYGQ